MENELLTFGAVTVFTICADSWLYSKFEIVPFVTGIVDVAHTSLVKFERTLTSIPVRVLLLRGAFARM